MEFWELNDIKGEYLNEVLTITTKSYRLVFDVSNTEINEWEYYYNHGFDYIFSGKTF